jgi:hypothetical protein
LQMSRIPHCSFHSGEILKQKGQLQARMWPVRDAGAAISLRM